MAVERTLSIIKPDAVAKNAIGDILGRFEAAGLQIIAAQMRHLSRAEAEGFYAVHRERPFFNDLVEFMTSGQIGRAHVSTPVTFRSRMPSSACKKKQYNLPKTF